MDIARACKKLELAALFLMGRGIFNPPYPCRLASTASRYADDVRSLRQSAKACRCQHADARAMAAASS